MLKIAMSGSHGVGKTTLLENLRERLKVPKENVIEEVAGKIIQLSKTRPEIRANENGTIEGQLQILTEQLHQESALVNKWANENGSDYAKAILLYDRTSWDALAYTYRLIRSNPNYAHLTAMMPSLLKWVREKSPLFDIIFYLPVQHAPSENGIRSSDLEFQRDMDGVMVDVLFDNTLGGVPLNGILSNKVIPLTGDAEMMFKRAMRKIVNHPSYCGTCKEEETLRNRNS